MGEENFAPSTCEMLTLRHDSLAIKATRSRWAMPTLQRLKIVCSEH
jgi:hypothetical protein